MSYISDYKAASIYNGFKLALEILSRLESKYGQVYLDANSIVLNVDKYVLSIKIGVNYENSLPVFDMKIMSLGEDKNSSVSIAKKIDDYSLVYTQSLIPEIIEKNIEGMKIQLDEYMKEIEDNEKAKEDKDDED